jgi:hypothetical protein
MADSNPYQNVQDNVREAFDDLLADESVYLPQKEATELFNLPDSVHIFFISASGRVSTFSEPSTLRIFKFSQQQDDGNQTFIQVGGWTHPLIPGVSPVFEAGNGAFMFPDAYGEDEGAAVGIVIADDSAFNVDGEAQVQLAKLLDELTISLKKEEAKDNDTNEHKLGPVGLAVFKGAKVVGKKVEQGAENSRKLIEYVADKQKAKIQVQDDHKDAKVNAALKTTVKGANYATKATVKVSGFVANRLGKLSKGLSNHLAKKMAPEPAVSGGEVAKKPRSSSSMYNLMDAARGGLLAYGTVYSSLEESAKVLGKSMKDNSVQVVEKKYGQEAGQLHLEAMTAAGNAAMTYMNIQSCGAKGLVKRTAKDTGKQVGKAVLEAHAK